MADNQPPTPADDAERVNTQSMLLLHAYRALRSVLNASRNWGTIVEPTRATLDKYEVHKVSRRTACEAQNTTTPPTSGRTLALVCACILYQGCAA